MVKIIIKWLNYQPNLGDKSIIKTIYSRIVNKRATEIILNETTIVDERPYLNTCM